MGHRLYLRFHKLIHNWRFIFTEELVALFLVLIIFAIPVAASTRFENRSLFINNPTPGATTSYEVSLRYATPSAVGSFDMLFCIDPIPYHPCVTPPGLDVSQAVLADQVGETGFSIQSRTTNRIVLTRPSVPISPGAPTMYKLDNIVNPTDTSQSYSIRLKSHASTNATGPQIDFGSVKSQLSDGITLQTQVPPMLIFCLAEEVHNNCQGTNDNFFTDMGELTHTGTVTAQSQMAVGTNASAGFAITVVGEPPTAGINTIDTLDVPTESTPGRNQFGINLVANNSPQVGLDPEGIWANALPSADYAQPNLYKFVNGDIVAYSPNVSLMKKFTVSYIVNASRNLRAGVYSTTLTFVASGRF